MNLIKEIKTTVTGVIIWTATALYFALPYFKSEKELWEVNSIWVASGIIVGLLLIVAPDKIIDTLSGGAKNFVSKFTTKKQNGTD